MANTMFASREELLNHLVTPLPLTSAQSADLFRDFQDSGYVARQENIGLTVLPALLGGAGITWVLIAKQGDTNSYGHTQVVMLSHPSLTDDEYDEWVGIVQGWAAALPPDGQTAISRKIRLQKSVENGIPLTILNEGMPAGLLLSYRRTTDYVIVIDSPKKGKRKNYTTRNIG